MERNKKPQSQRDHANQNTDQSDTSPSTNTATNTTHDCPECNGNIVKNDETDELICENCALVIDEKRIDHGPEWRAFNQQEKEQKSRVGTPTTNLMHDKGLSTKIGWQNKDASGRQISGKRKQQVQRLRKWDSRFKQESNESSLTYANGEIKRMGSALGATRKTQETAARIYKTAQRQDLIQGRSIEAISSAALYIAFRIHDQPRALDEIEQTSRIGIKPIQRTYMYLYRELGLELEPTDPIKYIPRITNDLNTTQQTVKTATTLLKEVKNTAFTSGRNPTVLAASAIYAASVANGNLLTQKAVRKASNVTEISIRNNYKELLAETTQVDITQEEIENANTPMKVASKITTNPKYVKDKRNKNEETK